jgi:HPt (histidine-containing phosphotransfer) domain-containing protein
MDDYIAKPVELARLLEKLDTWLPIPHDTPPLDLDALSRSVPRETMRREAFARFREFNDADVVALLAAIDARDLGQTIQVSHRIKGASRSLGARPLGDVCQRIEQAARGGDWLSIAANRGALLHEVNRLNDYLGAV